MNLEALFDEGEKREYDFKVSYEQKRRIQDLVQRTGKSISEIMRTFIKLGFMLDSMEGSNSSIIIKREKRIALFEGELSADTMTSPTQGSVTFVAEVPSVVLGEFQELANKRHATVEELTQEFLKIGLELAGVEEDPYSRIVIKEGVSENEVHLF